MKTIRFLLLLPLLLAGPALRAQQEDVVYRVELGAAAGIHFGLNDVNTRWYGNSQLGGGAVARFLLNPRMSVKTALSYGKISGKAENVDNFYPADPGTVGPEQLKFSASSDVFDLSALYELHFLPYGYNEGYQGYKRITPYLQMGIGFTYATGGKAFTANLPIGVGVKYKLAPRLNLGLEWRMHFSLSDKLDGLEAPLGIKSTAFKNKDHYSFTLLSITYDIAPRCPNCNKD